MVYVAPSLLYRLDEAGLSTRRFLRVRPYGKEAFEEGWPDDLHLPYDVGLNGENYGVAAGGGLVLIDADKEPLLSALKNKLPKTFTVLSPGHNAPQYYLKVEGEIGNLTLYYVEDVDGQPNNVGHVQASRKYLVGPNSIHPNGKPYIVVDDAPIATIPADELLGVLQPFLKESAKASAYVEQGEFKREGLGNLDFDIMQLLSRHGLKKGGKGEYYGAHPAHGSTTGRNFWVNSKNNIWCCFRCGSGGGSLTLLAVMEGIIKCSDAVPGGLKGEAFRKTVEAARLRGLIDTEKKEEKPKSIREKIDTIDTEKRPRDILYTQYISPSHSSANSANSNLKLLSSEEEIVDDIFKYIWKDNLHTTVKIDPKKHDLIRFQKGDKFLTDTCRIRDSEHSRKLLASNLEKHQLLFKTEALELLFHLSNDLNRRMDITRQLERRETEPDLSSVIENDIDPSWLLKPEIFSLGVKLLNSDNLLTKLINFIGGLLVSDRELREDIIYNQCSICAPPLRRYNPTSEDYVLERGQETILAFGKSGTGKGALMKLLRLFGVRIVISTRITRPVLERYASTILHHTTLVISEIETLYKIVKGEKGKMEETETDVATILKQAIEDNKITLVVMEHDENGMLKPKVYSTEVYPAPIMASIQNIENIQMKTRAKITNLPSDLAGFLQIGDMISRNIMLENIPKVEVNGHFSANNVKLIFHLINGITEGIVWNEYVNLSEGNKKIIEKILGENGLTPDHLKPIDSVTLKKELRDEIYKTWLNFILEFTLDPISKVEGENGSEEINRNDLVENINNGKFLDVIETVKSLGLDISKVEGLTRDLLHAYRRTQSSSLLNIFKRKFHLTEKGEKRVLEADHGDCKAGINLLRKLMPQRVNVGLTGHELEILYVLKDQPNTEFTAREVALKFYEQPQVKPTVINYVRRVLNKASELKYVIKTSGKPNKYKFEGVETGKSGGEDASPGNCEICGEYSPIRYLVRGWIYGSQGKITICQKCKLEAV